jgi:hypothetical protein
MGGKKWHSRGRSEMGRYEAIRWRASPTCFCGNSKASGDPYCLACFILIPAELRRGLYTVKDYEQTIEKCDSAINGLKVDGSELETVCAMRQGAHAD